MRMIFAILVMTFFFFQVPARANEKEVELLGKGFQANIESFKFYKVTYQITQSHAKSLEDAKAERFINSSSCSYRYTKDGKMVRFQTISEIHLPKKGDFLYPPINFLGDDKWNFHGFEPFRSVTRYPVQTSGDMNTPWCFFAFEEPLDSSIYAPHRIAVLLKNEQPNTYQVTKPETAEFNGKAVIRFSLICNRKTFCLSLTYELCPELGYLPLRIIQNYYGAKAEEGVKHETVVELKEYEKRGKGFFPMEYTAIQKNASSQKDSDYTVRRFKVLELNTETRPSKRDLSLSLPAGTLITTPYELPTRGSFRLQQDELIHPDDFDRIDKLLKIKEKDPEALIETIINQPPKFYQRWWFYVICGVAALALIGLLRYRRSRVKA
jgi:hypothetical protein